VSALPILSGQNLSDILADMKKADAGKKGRASDDSDDDRPKKKSASKTNGKAKGKR
jgi:hypothetical protein